MPQIEGATTNNTAKRPRRESYRDRVAREGKPSNASKWVRIEGSEGGEAMPTDGGVLFKHGGAQTFIPNGKIEKKKDGEREYYTLG